MITIKELKNDQAELNIEKGTQNTTIFLGIQMLIACLMEQGIEDLTIDSLLNDLKDDYLIEGGKI